MKIQADMSIFQFFENAKAVQEKRTIKENISNLTDAARNAFCD